MGGRTGVGSLGDKRDKMANGFVMIFLSKIKFCPNIEKNRKTKQNDLCQFEHVYRHIIL